MKSKYLMLFLLILLLQGCMPKAVVTNSKKSAQYNMSLGLAYLYKGDYILAKDKLLKAIQQDANAPNVNAALAYYFEKVGDINLAYSYYKKALNIAPKDGSNLNNYAAFLCRIKQYQKANVYFIMAINDVNYVNTAAVLENAGLCNKAMFNYKKASLYFKKALQQDPSRVSALIELVEIAEKQNNLHDICKYLGDYANLTAKNLDLIKIKTRVC